MEEGSPHAPQVNLCREVVLCPGVDQSSLVHEGVEVLLCAMQGCEGLLGAQLSSSAKVSQFEHIAGGISTCVRVSEWKEGHSQFF